MPRRARSWIGSRVMSSPSQRIAPGADRMRAGDRAQQAGLAHAVASQQAGHRADLRGQRHLPQRDGGAVVQIDVIDFKHRVPCHCEERSDEAIPIQLRAQTVMEIASSLRSSQ